MRLLFLGSGAFGVPTLAHLAQRAAPHGHEVVGICTQPDKPAGRGRTLTPTPVAAWVGDHAPHLPVAKPDSVNEAGTLAALRRDFGPGGTQRVDAWVVIAFGQKLSEPLLEGVRAINLHASLLPRWRGAAPINAAVLAGDTTTGNTVISLAQRMDAGLVFGQTRRPIEPEQTAGELHDLLAADGPALVARVLTALAEGGARGVPQDESLATRAPKLGRADSWIDFCAAARACRARVHGLTPWPGVAVRLPTVKGDRVVKLLRVAAHETPAGGPAAPGTLIDPHAGLVACGAGVLCMLDVQPEGGRPMRWSAFAAGQAPQAGSVVASVQPVPPRA